MVSEKKLLKWLEERPGQVFKARAIARELDVINRDYRLFRQLLKTLTEQGKIARYKGNQFGKRVKQDLFTGRLHVKTQGYGFLIREDSGEDIFISQKHMGSALHGDRIQVQVWAHQTGRLPEGRVVVILERKKERLVGVFMEGHAYNYLIPDDMKMTRDIYLGSGNSRNALPGQKVVAEIIDWGDAGRMPEGKVIEVLGFPDEPGVDVLTVARIYDLQDRFSQNAEKEAAGMPDEFSGEEIGRRLDLRDRLIFTIDPEDAKDFDDAVSLEKLENGNFRLGVHIADVSFYVSPGSAVDQEALARATSVYLVDRVIPMLPERLSNELCSLKPEKDRLTYSVLMELTPQGDVADYQFQESVIRSRFRLSYEKAQKIIDARSPASVINILKPARDASPFHLNNSQGEEETVLLYRTLKEMHRLSQVLLENWRQAGSIDFNAPEPLVRLNRKGEPIELGVRPRYASHRLIEAFMLLANRTVAESVLMRRQDTGQKMSFIFRVHQRPSEEKLDKFTDFIRAFGYDFDPGKKLTPKKFQHFLDSVKNPRHKPIIDEVAVRTMMKAIYTTANIGHFGLACKAYTHFTSPIRRYPDLMVHRLLKAYHQPAPRPLQFILTLAQIASQASDRELTAMEAERESIRAKQTEYMAGHLGMEFDGIISGVTGFGFYVEIPEFLVEGLVSVRDLTDDYYIYDEKKWLLRGERNKKVYRLGDSVRVEVVRVHPEMRRMDFMLAGLTDTDRNVRHKKRQRKNLGKKR
jgi:ribonuclease R